MRRISVSHSRRSGFSIIELVIVLVIVAIIAIVSIPRSTVTNDAKVKEAAELIAAHLRYAQQLSITTGFKHGIAFTINPTNTYRVYRDDPSDGAGTIANDPNDPYDPGNKNDAANPGKLVVDLTKAPFKTVDITGTNFNGLTNRKVIFDTLNGAPQQDNEGAGVALSPAGTVTLSRGGTTFTVSIQVETGKVTVTSP